MIKLCGKSVRVYIDYANVRPWSNKLGWHIDIMRLKQFLDSFQVIEAVNFYNGYLEGDKKSERDIKDIENQRYIVRTKPVKVMKFSIDVSSILPNSTTIIDQFIKRSLLRKFDNETIRFLNKKFKDMNKKGKYYIEDRKCNFDVEIGVDMLLDNEKTKTDTFILWSGDSDFADPAKKLIKAGKKVIIFGTSGKISRELSELRKSGLIIFEVNKIKEFICWNKELKSKRDFK